MTAGLTMGYGVSACFMVVSSLPAQYFNKRRGLANGLVYAGGGVGGAVISLSMSAIVESLGTAWTFRLLGLVMLITGLPAAYLIQERAPSHSATFVEWKLLRDPQFVVIFIMGVIATFPLLVPPFFVPLYARSLGLSARVGAGLLAAYNFSSAVGRVLCGFLGDEAGPINSLFIALTTSALSMLAIWPVSTSLAPLIAFFVINGLGNGAFFSIMPTVVSSVFGSARLSIRNGHGGHWLDGWLPHGPSDRRLSSRCIWWRVCWPEGVPTCYVLCWDTFTGCSRPRGICAPTHIEDPFEAAVILPSKNGQPIRTLVTSIFVASDRRYIFLTAYQSCAWMFWLRSGWLEARDLRSRRIYCLDPAIMSQTIVAATSGVASAVVQIKLPRHDKLSHTVPCIHEKMYVACTTTTAFISEQST